MKNQKTYNINNIIGIIILIVGTLFLVFMLVFLAFNPPKINNTIPAEITIPKFSDEEINNGVEIVLDELIEKGFGFDKEEITIDDMLNGKVYAHFDPYKFLGEELERNPYLHHSGLFSRVFAATIVLGELELEETSKAIAVISLATSTDFSANKEFFSLLEIEARKQANIQSLQKAIDTYGDNWAYNWQTQYNMSNSYIID